MKTTDLIGKKVNYKLYVMNNTSDMGRYCTTGKTFPVEMAEYKNGMYVFGEKGKAGYRQVLSTNAMATLLEKGQYVSKGEGSTTVFSICPEEKSYEELRERAIEWLIFDATNKEFGCLRNDFTRHLNKCEAYELLFGRKEYGLIVEEVKRRIEERGLTEQEPWERIR